jgi:hypothetical protein
MSVEKKITDEAKKLLPQIYTDVAQPAAQEIGNVLGRSVKTLLAPIRGFLWIYVNEFGKQFMKSCL